LKVVVVKKSKSFHFSSQVVMGYN